MKIPAPRILIADSSPVAQDILTELKLGDSFRMSMETKLNFFYDLVEFSQNLTSLDEMKEKVLKPIDNEFGEDILRITPASNVVCKYKDCPFKLNFKHTKSETEETYTFVRNYPNSIKVHSVIAHKTKNIKDKLFI